MMPSTAVEQSMTDRHTRFLEMKSVQPYSTTDEYIYAMKEDLADWFSNMYPEWRPINADNFLECLGEYEVYPFFSCTAYSIN